MISVSNVERLFVESPVQAMYLDYINNFITVEGFANIYKISTGLAEQIIKEGKKIHESQFS